MAGSATRGAASEVTRSNALPSIACQGRVCDSSQTAANDSTASTTATPRARAPRKAFMPIS